MRGRRTRCDEAHPALRSLVSRWQRESDRISAVQYLRFALPPGAALRLADPRLRARIRIDPPAYAREAELTPELRAPLGPGLLGPRHGGAALAGRSPGGPLPAPSR